MLLSDIQKTKIIKNISGKKGILYILWVGIFGGINFYINELSIIGWGFLEYENTVKIPYIFFGIGNALLVGLNINLLIDKMKELRNLNPGSGVLSIFGTFLALLTGACPGCVAGLFPLFVGLLGSTTTLYDLPFGGVELQILTSVFLLLGIYFLSKDMVCKINGNKKNAPHKRKLIFIIVMTFIGLINSILLTYYVLKIRTEVYSFGGAGSGKIICNYNDLFSCSGIFNEQFAWFFGISFSMFAIVLYVGLIILAFLGIWKKGKQYISRIFYLSLVVGVLNIYMIINQYSIGKYCIICLVSTGVILFIGVISGYGYYENKKLKKQRKNRDFVLT